MPPWCKKVGSKWAERFAQTPPIRKKVAQRDDNLTDEWETT